MAEEIKVEIHAGSVKISVKGAKGKSCETLTRDIEASLGSVKTKTFTADHKQAAEVAGNKAVQR